MRNKKISKDERISKVKWKKKKKRHCRYQSSSEVNIEFAIGRTFVILAAITTTHVTNYNTEDNY
jgi:hypothetical protein